jgi:hypothetical protein
MIVLTGKVLIHSLVVARFAGPCPENSMENIWKLGGDPLLADETPWFHSPAAAYSRVI